MDVLVTNAELTRLIDKAITRFNNWSTQVEKDPNPRMVHSLKNIMSIIESVSVMADQRVEYSYKNIVQKTAKMLSMVAELNNEIAISLENDDMIDEDEEKRIVLQLMNVITSATDLIKTAQEGFKIK